MHEIKARKRATIWWNYIIKLSYCVNSLSCIKFCNQNITILPNLAPLHKNEWTTNWGYYHHFRCYMCLSFCFLYIVDVFFTLNSDSITLKLWFYIILFRIIVLYFITPNLSIFSQSNSKMTMKLNELSVGEPLVNQQRIQHWAAKVWSRNNKVFKIVWKFSTIMWVPILY